MLRTIGLEWQHSRLYRLYILLLLAGFLKQCIDYATLVDAAEYLQAAHHLMQGNWSSCGDLLPCGTHWLEATRRTPGYPVLLLLVGFMPLLMLAVQGLLAAFIPLWSIQLLARIETAPRSRKLLMIAFIFYPLQFFYSNFLMPEIWVQALVLLGVLHLASKNYGNIPLILSALVLLKPVFIIFLPISLVLLLRTQQRRWFQLMPVAVVLMVSGVNFRNTGWFHFTAMAVENTYEYNMRAVMNRVNTPNEIEALYKNYSTILKPLRDAERAQFMRRVSSEKISKHLPVYFMLHVLGSVATLLDPGRYDLVAFWGIKDVGGFMNIKTAERQLPPWPQLFYMGVLLLWRLVLLWLAMRWWLQRNNWFLRMLIVIPLLLLPFSAGPVGSARYLFPVAPLLFVMAAAGLNTFRNKQNHEADLVA
ncbi:MAG: hypothetical protein RL160_1740 [Bacteroidota bacterium]